MITVSAELRERCGEFMTEKIERVLNYPIGADLILHVNDRGWRPAELTTVRHRKIPLLVIHDRELIQKALKAEREGWRVMFETRIPKGDGDEYVVSIKQV